MKWDFFFPKQIGVGKKTTKPNQIKPNQNKEESIPSKTGSDQEWFSEWDLLWLDQVLGVLSLLHNFAHV